MADRLFTTTLQSAALCPEPHGPPGVGSRWFLGFVYDQPLGGFLVLPEAAGPFVVGQMVTITFPEAETP